MKRKYILILCLTALAIVAARSTVAPVWDTCPPPAISPNGRMPVIYSCVHQIRECPSVYDLPNYSLQCWVWFPGNDAMAPHWYLADR